MTSGVRMSRLVVVITLVLGVPGAAHAGGPGSDDPHMYNEACEASSGATVHVAGDRVICEGWFSTLLDEHETDQSGAPAVYGMRTTLHFLEPSDDAALTRVVVSWSRDGCREQWRLDSTLAEGTALFLERRCGDEPYRTHQLDVRQADIRGGRMTVDVRRKDLETLGSGLRTGDVLATTSAWRAVLLAPSHSLAAEATAESSSAAPRRDFVVGAD